MLIENAFDVKAPPERVYNFLPNVNKVVAWVPGAELVGQVDPQTFKGKVKIKVGPRVAAPAKPINAIGLLFSIIVERIRGWFGR